jgi:hypothetical protein
LTKPASTIDYNERSGLSPVEECQWRNQASRQPVPIPEETKDEAGETDMELYIEECHDLLYDLDTPDKKDEWGDIKETNPSIFPSR